MTHEEILQPLDTAIWELGEAFGDLPDPDVWVRAHPRLLSIGELAVHIAYGEIRWMNPELQSPFSPAALGPEVGYYPYAIDKPLVLELGASAIYDEAKRVHEACKATILRLRPDLASKLPYRDDWTWGTMLEYMAFHIAYHTGQIYSVRHILGHDTPDN